MKSEAQQNMTSAEQRRQEQDDFERLMNLPRIKQSDVNTTSMMFDPLISRRIQTFAKMLSEGNATVPEHLRGNLGDCLAIAMQAATWGLNPFLVAQKTHLIHGRLGYEAQLVSAIVSSLGLLEGRFSYEYGGNWKKIQKAPRIVEGRRGAYPEPGWEPEDEDGLTITVIGKLRGDKEPKLLDPPLALATVWPRNSTLWAISPQQQIAYLATKQWIRRYAPDAILGVYTPDEIAQEDLLDISSESKKVMDVSSASAEVMERARALKQKETAIDVPSDTADTSEAAPKQIFEPDKQDQYKASLAHKSAQGEDEDDEWPQERDGVLVDCRGVPWHRDFYSIKKTCTDAGTWRKRRGASQTDIDRYEARYVAKTETGGTAIKEEQNLPFDADPPQNEQRTVEHRATEEQMRQRINQANSSDELEELIVTVGDHPGWDTAVKEDLLELARGHHADWLEVERQERENRQDVLATVVDKVLI